MRKFRWRLLAVGLLCCEAGVEAAVFLVANTNESGAGSLRQAMLEAGTAGGPDRIEFSIPGLGPHTIVPTNALPQIVEPLTIDATTQSGYAGQPRVVLSGERAGASAHGLLLLAGHCEVRGLAIRNFGRDGIHMEGGGTNVIQANHLGTDATGSNAGGNAGAGITVYQSAGNQIGGTHPSERNLISGGNGTGIYLYGSGSSQNRIEGNHIGTDSTGTTKLGNVNNGILLNAAAENFIGGPGAGNLISGNGQSGVYLLGAQTRGNRIEGNRVGVRADGGGALGNGGDGITLDAGSGNRIGGGHPGEGNLIAGNTVSGVFIGGASGRSNVIAGNFIGVGSMGANGIPNNQHGVEVQGPWNQIGPSNLISGNLRHGVYLAGTNAHGNQVAGNLIGCDAGGSGALANGACGITVNQGSSNRIGGCAVSARNIVSGNTQTGIYLSGSNAVGNVVEGNFVGTDRQGVAKLPNQNGVGISDAPRNRVGGCLPPARNVVSGNSGSGIFLMGAGAISNSIHGNFIGTDATGEAALGNSKQGIFVSAASNLIGGTAAGAGNVVSGNANVGISIGDPVSVSNVVAGNFIGTKADGVGPLGNLWHGVEILNSASGTLIGSTIEDGANHIADAKTAGYDGVRVRDGCIGNSIQGNKIFGNADLGIDLGTGGPNANDPLDPDGGANGGQNHPVLSAANGRYRTTIHGTLNSQAAGDYVIDFQVSPTRNPNGYGQGREWLGRVIVRADGQGNAAFTVNFTNPGPVMGWISSTATDEWGNTSEFSESISNSVAETPDTDGDGMPDDYEAAWGFNLGQIADGEEDADGDGGSNVRESHAGTSPRNALEALRFTAPPEAIEGEYWLRFATVPERLYQVEQADDLSGPWSVLAASLKGNGKTILVKAAAAPAAPRKFYRLGCRAL